MSIKQVPDAEVMLVERGECIHAVKASEAVVSGVLAFINVDTNYAVPVFS